MSTRDGQGRSNILAVGALVDRAGSDAYSRPGRGDECFHAGGTFLDEGAAPLASLRPCS